MSAGSHIRMFLRDQVETLAAQLKSWQQDPKIDENEEVAVLGRLQFFEHTTHRKELAIAGVHGSGDFPVVRFGDSFVYFTTAQSSLYVVDPVSKLRELDPALPPLALITWLPEEFQTRRREFEQALERLAGIPIPDVMEASDYKLLKSIESRSAASSKTLRLQLVFPEAGDSGNISIQLRSTAELGAVFKLIQREDKLDYILINTTFSLPMVGLKTGSLFFEHQQRLACLEATERGIAFLGLSQSHGFPSIEIIEGLARERAGLERGVAEHWYLRLPIPKLDPWKLALAETRRVPPPGVVSYLVRFHRTFPVMRLDMDREFWRKNVQGKNQAQTMVNEQRIFQDLDYSSHDQRCYGFPYPLYAAKERTRFTKSEKSALRKQIVDAAVQAGLQRSQFREVESSFVGGLRQ